MVYTKWVTRDISDRRERKKQNTMGSCASSTEGRAQRV